MWVLRLQHLVPGLHIGSNNIGVVVTYDIVVEAHDSNSDFVGTIVQARDQVLESHYPP